MLCNYINTRIYLLIKVHKTLIISEKQMEINKQASDQLIAIKEVKHGLRTPEQYKTKYKKNNTIDQDSIKFKQH